MKTIREIMVACALACVMTASATAGDGFSAASSIDVLDGGTQAATSVRDLDFGDSSAWTVSQSGDVGQVSPVFGSASGTFAEGNDSRIPLAAPVVVAWAATTSQKTIDWGVTLPDTTYQPVWTWVDGDPGSVTVYFDTRGLTSCIAKLSAAQTTANAVTMTVYPVDTP